MRIRNRGILGRGIVIAIEQQHQSAQIERRYSPEEAGEILKLAASLQDDSFSVEQLRGIAREAGVSDEQLHRAIEHYEQQKRRLLERRRERSRRLKIFLLVGMPLIIAVGMCFPLFRTSEQVSTNAYPAAGVPFPSTGEHEFSSVEGESLLLASSETCKVYKFRVIDNYTPYEQARIHNLRSNESFVVGHLFKKLTFASISPTGKHVAFYGEATGEVWVAVTDGSGLQRVARSSEIIGDDVLIGGNPIAGWSPAGGRDRLKARTLGGDTILVFVEE